MRTAEEFWNSVDTSTTCWEWQRSVDTGGYGHLNWRGRMSRAHRVAYELANNVTLIRSNRNVVVMHTCDNRRCCNPDHLHLGTHADNMGDMASKGRRKDINSGARNGRAKLTPEQVAAIREDKRGKRTIAPEYGVSPAQVQRIRKGQQWK